MSEYLESRSMSGFPVSIGTGLALETIFNPTQEVVDEGRDFKKLSDPNYYDLYAINVATLVRNMLSSIEDSKSIAKIKLPEFYECIEEEIDLITIMFGEKNLKVVFYINSYQYYKRLYPRSMRIASTEKQIKEDTVIKYVCDKISSNDKDVKSFNHLISFDKANKTLLLSHYPVDLLSHTKFRTLDLLESHTGKIKTRKDYNTKYYPIPREDMSSLPFFEYLLVVFGDKVMFRPDGIKRRQDVMEQLRKLNVTPLTSEISLRKHFK